MDVFLWRWCVFFVQKKVGQLVTDDDIIIKSFGAIKNTRCVLVIKLSDVPWNKHNKKVGKSHIEGMYYQLF
mgnify:CR=1 FL=1